MAELFDAYWWLLFPVMAFAMGGFSLWLNYRRSRDVLDLIKTYADQGKEPPEALIRAFAGGQGPQPDVRPGLWAPDGEARRAFTFLALALGFGIGAWWTGEEPVRLAFGVVAIVMGIAGLGSLVGAVFAARRRPPQ